MILRVRSLHMVLFNKAARSPTKLTASLAVEVVLRLQQAATLSCDAAPKEKPYISAIHGRPPGSTSRSFVSRHAWCNSAMFVAAQGWDQDQGSGKALGNITVVWAANL